MSAHLPAFPPRYALLALGLLAFAPWAWAAETGDIDWFNMSMGLFGGLALFLYGMEVMTRALKSAAGERMQQILAGLTGNRFLGVLTGATITAVTQSSTITTVLVVGFVASHLMNLAQVTGVIMGANIGSTVTAQIIAFKITHYSLLLIAVGFAVEFAAAKYERIKHAGSGVMGLGLLFLGMMVISDAMQPLQGYPYFLELMAGMSQPLPAVLLGLAFTAVVQSSAATVGIVIVMAGHGFISLEAGIAIAFGANIGTCITAMLATIGKSRDAVRAALIHVLFNVAGVLVWFAFIPQMAEVTRWLSPAATDLEGAARLAAEVPRQIANANTLFNIANVVLFIGFAGVFARVVRFLVPDRIDPEQERLNPRYLNTLLLSSPAMALASARRELERVGWRVEKMLDTIMPAMMHGDHATLTQVEQMDNEVDILHGHIINYLGEISKQNLNHKQTQTLFNLMGACNHLENIGDLVETNLVALGRQRLKEGIHISKPTQEKLIHVQKEVAALVRTAITAVTQNDLELAREVVAQKARVNHMLDETLVYEAHRLIAAEPGRIAAYSLETDILEQFKRIYHFAKRIAHSQLETEEKSKNTAAPADPTPPETPDPA